jgi:O-antigen/teichoic acid export membrane protein
MKINKRRNLSKLAIKNSFYSFSSTLIAKLGGVILTIVLARMLLPEAFGIYAVVLSIVVITFSFTNFGIGESTVKFVSELLGKNKKVEAFSHFWYFLKIETMIILLVATILLLLSQVLANDVFNKPEIFVPLLFAILFIIINSLRSFFGSIFTALNFFSATPLIYFILHGTKVIFSLIALSIFSGINAVSAVFVAFSISSFISLLSMIVILKMRKINLFFKKRRKIANKPVLKYLGFMSVATISLVIFGAVDTLMLGIFVDAAYIGYYQVAFSLVVSLVAIFSVSGILFPIFTQIYGARLNRALLKSLRYTLLLSIPAVVGLIFIAQPIIPFLFGKEYAPAIHVLYVLSFLLLVTPCISLYSNLFNAKGKVKIIAWITIASLILNILLNYIFITNLLQFGQNFAILGAATATLASRIFYLSVILVNSKRIFKIQIPKTIILKSLFAAGIMALALFAYNAYININIATLIVEILFGIIIYGIILFLIKGITKEDINLIKLLIKR